MIKFSSSSFSLVTLRNSYVMMHGPMNIKYIQRMSSISGSKREATSSSSIAEVKMHGVLCLPLYIFTSWSLGRKTCLFDCFHIKTECFKTLLQRNVCLLTFQSLAVSLRTTRLNVYKFCVVLTCFVPSQNKQRTSAYTILTLSLLMSYIYHVPLS